MSNPLSPTRDEENRRLAEWIEPNLLWKYAFLEHEDVGICWMPSDGGAYRRLYVDGELQEEMPADFFSDEAANAMLLEKMPRPRLYKTEYGKWHIFADGNTRYDFASEDIDRKAAIVKAALAYLEAQK